MSDHLLSLLIFLPSAGALVLLLFPESQPRAIKAFSLLVALAELAASLPLWTRFTPGRIGFQFTENADWIPSLGISCSFC